MSGPRLYIGRLAPDVRRGDIEDFFKGYGTIIDVTIKGTFGFVEWDNPQDAEDVLKEFNGKTFMGERIILEPAKEARPRDRRDPYGGDPRGGYGGYPPYGGGYGYPPPPPRGGYGPPGYDRYGGYPPYPPPRAPPRLRRGEFRIIVSNLPPNTSWQDLKDVGREHGQVSFSDVDPSRPDEGVLEFDSRDDFDRALERIEGMEFRGNKLRADAAKVPSRGDDDRRDRDRDRGGDRDRERSPPRRRDDDRDRDRDRGDRDRGGRYDSRSPPPRRERDDDEPRRRDYD